MIASVVRPALLECHRKEVLAVILGLFGVVAGLVGGVSISDLAVFGSGPGSMPGIVLLGLAARSGSDRSSDIERLTDDLRGFVSRLRDDTGPTADGTDADRTVASEPVDFTIERDDEIGRLSEVVDELTTTVRERERRRAESERYRRELYRVTSDPDLQGEAKVRRLLELGCERLGVETGFVSRIDESTARYEIETVEGGEDELEGAILSLSDVYCAETITSDGILGIYDADATGYGEHPNAVDFGIHCYIGGEIVVDGELYGTLCFVDRGSRDRPFTPAEKSFVELMSRWLSLAFERREHVRALRERERRLERARAFTDDVLDAVDDVVYLLDEDGEVQRWNESLCTATGYTDAEIDSMHALDFFDEPDRDRVANTIEDVLETGRTRIEVPLQTKSGERIPYEFVASALEDPAGNRALAGIGRDISERKTKERRLERYRAFTNDVLDALDDVFYVLDADGELRRWNETLVEVSGYSDDEIAEMDALDFFDESNRDTIRDSMGEAFETGETHVEAELQTKSGERIPYEFIASVIEDPEGNPVEVGIGRDITERREKERRLREREARLERTTSLLEQAQRLANVGAWELDVSTEPFDLQWTAEIRRILGLPDDEPIDIERAFEFYHPNDRPRIRAAVDRAIEEGEPYDLELRMQTVDGDLRWVRSISDPIRDHDGEIVTVRGSIQDITERKERERELERTETVIQALDELVYTLDAEGRFTFLNDAITSITGYEPDDLIGEHVSTVMTETDLEAAQDLIRELLRGDEPSQTFEMDLVTVDGDVIDVENHMALLPMANGEFTGTAGVIRDITERKERERDLERFETIVQALDELVYTLDAEGCFTFLNDAAEPILGYEPAELIGEPAATVIPSDDVKRARDRIRELLRGDERSRTVEILLETIDGDEIDVENHIALLPADDGEFAGTAGVVRDITERKERERRLETTSARLEALFEHSPDMIDVLDTTGTIVDANRRLADELGYAEDELVGTKIWEHDTLIDADEVATMLADLSVGDRRKFEGEYRRRGGSTLPVEIHLICLDIENENRFMAISRDITERKERERDLRETKRRLELALKGTNTGVWVWDLNDDTVAWNETLERLVGLDPGAFGGTFDAFRQRLHPDDVARVETAITEAIENDRLYQTEFRIRHEAGHWLWVGARGRLVDDEEGRRMVGINNDITERKERERELERTTELLKQAERLAGIGGWELDVSDDSRDVTLTNGLRRLYELPLDTTVDSELASSFPHPDDRDDVLETVDRALEAGEDYEIEHRMRTAEGNERWVRSIGEPVLANDVGGRSGVGVPSVDDIVGVRGTIQDITERKERELALESLHDAARDLLGANTEREVAELVVETAGDILDASGAAVYRLDSGVNRLVPAASTSEFERLCDGTPAVDVGNDDSVLWSTYVTRTGTVVEDPASFDRSRVFGPDVESGVVVPIGDHGVFAVATDAGPIDTEARRLIETLVATTEAAFDRLESEASLREREAELEDRNERLNRQIETTELIRRIDQVLIGAESRQEIERTVPERLLEVEGVRFAWIGELDSGGAQLEPRTWAGDRAAYLDDVALADDAPAEPAVRTARSETPTVVSNVVEGLQDEPWRRQALDRGFQSVISVPLSHAEYSYGVLTVYADDPDAFGDLERTVLTELGEGIADAITAVKTREALHAETVLELTLRIEGGEDLLSRLATKTGARVEYEGLGSHAADEALLFFETSGASSDDVRAALDDLVSVTEYRLISESEGECRFEATTASDLLASRLVRHGGSPRSMVADGDRTEVTVDVPTGTDVREFVEMLREGYGAVDLQARRHAERSMGTRSELVTSLFDALTDRQLEVLRTAYFAGFFEWPRESTGEEIADMLAVTQPTVNRHLRLGQQRLLAQLFEDEFPVPPA